MQGTNGINIRPPATTSLYTLHFILVDITSLYYCCPRHTTKIYAIRHSIIIIKWSAQLLRLLILLLTDIGTEFKAISMYVLELPLQVLRYMQYSIIRLNIIILRGGDRYIKLNVTPNTITSMHAQAIYSGGMVNCTIQFILFWAFILFWGTGNKTITAI